MPAKRSRVLAAVVGAVLATVLLVPGSSAAATTDPAPRGLLQGLVLTGSCPGASSDLKNVIATARSASPWAPLTLADGNFTDLHKLLLPYSIVVTGQGLKTRHAVPELPYVRPGPAPRNPVTCVFSGATKEDGAFTVTIVGSVWGCPWWLIWKDD